MDDMKRGDDAADHVPPPKPGGEKRDGEKRDKDQRQDAPNYDRTTDKGAAIPDEDVNSANDE